MVSVPTTRTSPAQTIRCGRGAGARPLRAPRPASLEQRHGSRTVSGQRAANRARQAEGRSAAAIAKRTSSPRARTRVCVRGWLRRAARRSSSRVAAVDGKAPRPRTGRIVDRVGDGRELRLVTIAESRLGAFGHCWLPRRPCLEPDTGTHRAEIQQSRETRIAVARPYNTVGCPRDLSAGVAALSVFRTTRSPVAEIERAGRVKATRSDRR